MLFRWGYGARELRSWTVSAGRGGADLRGATVRREKGALLMGKQTIKQQARRAALDAQTTRRAEHEERERRLQGLVVQVLIAIRERDQAAQHADRRAGEALTEMIETERLTARDAAQYCGDEMSPREIARLRRVAAAPARAAGDAEPGESGPVVPGAIDAGY